MALINRWPLTSNATDVVGGLTTTNNGNVMFDSENGANFNGINQSLTFSKNFGTTFSLSCWVKFDIANLTGLNSPFCGDSAEGSAATGLGFSNNSEYILTFCKGDNISFDINNKSNYSFDFISLILDFVNLKAYYYRNNILEKTINLNSTISTYPVFWALGCRTTGSDSYYRYKGNILDARIYDTALTKEEIAMLYTAGPNGKSFDLIVGSDLNIFSYYDGVKSQKTYYPLQYGSIMPKVLCAVEYDKKNNFVYFINNGSAILKVYRIQNGKVINIFDISSISSGNSYYGSHIDKDMNFYISDGKNILKIGPNDITASILQGLNTVQAPAGITSNSNGDLFITDYMNKQICVIKYNMTSIFKRINVPYYPRTICCDGNNNIICGCTYGSSGYYTVYIDNSTLELYTAKQYTNTNVNLKLVKDSLGNVWGLPSDGSNNIYKFSKDSLGTYTTITSIQYPYDICTDIVGNMYITSYSAKSIYQIVVNTTTIKTIDTWTTDIPYGIGYIPVYNQSTSYNYPNII